MGFFDELKKIARPYSDDEDEYEYEDEVVDEEGEYEYDEEPEEAPARSGRRSAAPSYSTAPETRRPGSRVVSMNAAPQSQVVVVKPDQYEKVADIADHLLEKHAILLNLEDMNKDSARRLIDFLCGCAYALNGKIRKVATQAYLIVPYNVEILGDLSEELSGEGTYL